MHSVYVKKSLAAPYVMAEANLLEIVLKALLMPFATLPMPTVAAKAISATTSAYSIRSWPSSYSKISNLTL